MNNSAEQTISHISAIITPIIGGTVWVMFGSQTPFLVEVLIALVSPVLAQAIRTPSGTGCRYWPARGLGLGIK